MGRTLWVDKGRRFGALLDRRVTVDSDEVLYFFRKLKGSGWFYHKEIINEEVDVQPVLNIKHYTGVKTSHRVPQKYSFMF